MKSLKILGCDPGIGGAVALISAGGGRNFPRIEILDLPIVDTGFGHRIHFRRFREILQDWKPDVAYLEEVWPRPVGTPGGGMGFVSAGRFMKTAGALQALVYCEVEERHIHMVTPHQWKKFFKLGPSKDQARALAVDLFLEAAPLLRLKKNHNRAEACLIAAYGACRYGMLDLQLL